MKVVVVGGSGNISVAIVDLLLKEGHEVVCFNRGQTKKEMLPKQVKQIHGDRHDVAFFEKVMLEQAPDVAIDMICFTAQDAESDLRAFPNVSRLVFCSTVNVYGINSAHLPLKEDDKLEPVSAYGRGKMEAEAVFRAAWFEKQYPVTIFRPSTTYGKQVGLIGSVGRSCVWIDRVKKGKPVLVCGSGNNMHHFMHVKDAAQAFVQSFSLPHTVGQVYNLVANEYLDWNTYHKLGMKVLGKEVPIVGVPLDFMLRAGVERFGNVYESFAHNTYYDASKLYRDFPDFRTNIALEDGMREVIAWCEENDAIPNCDDYPIEDAVATLLLEGSKSV